MGGTGHLEMQCRSSGRVQPLALDVSPAIYLAIEASLGCSCYTPHTKFRTGSGVLIA